MALLDRLIAGSVGFIPKSLIRRVAWRYVAGETFDAEVRCGHGAETSVHHARAILRGDELILEL